MAGLRELDERLLAVEKRCQNLCATCELKHIAEQLRDWKKDAFDDLINSTEQKMADFNYKADCIKDEIKKWKEYSIKLFKYVKKHGY